MASRSSWDGAIDFAGFSINIKAFALLKSKSAESFKTLCACHHQPIAQANTCRDDGRILDTATETVKGVEQSKGVFTAMPPEALDQIRSQERSIVLTPVGFPAKVSVPLHLATGQYRIVPNEKVPGSEGPTSVLWNGLIAAERCLVTEWTLRAGSRPGLVAVHADDYGLTATALPYVTDFNDVPEWKPVVNEQAQQTFEMFVEQSYSIDDFAHGTFTDTYSERRRELIAQALAGEQIAPAQAPTAQAAVPDLMAAMSNAMAAAGAKPKKKAAKPKTPVKV